MENKINIAELLKDCPKGMELDSTMLEGLEFDGIVDNEYLPIRCRVKNPDGGYNVYNFTKYGCWLDTTFAKCVIFPKGKTTWEGFVPPCKFKDGDVLAYQCQGYKNRTIYIYMQHNKMNTTFYVALSGYSDSEFIINQKKEYGYALNGYNDTVRLATEEEKEKLFQAIKDNGYHWNDETKTLEKLPKFKVGDRIKHKEKTRWVCTIARVKDRYYVDGHPMCFTLPFGKQDDYELVPNKFDITTLVPFESRVLVRDSNKKWRPAVYGFCNKFETRCAFYAVGGCVFEECIPYEGNEHLLGTTDDCDEYFKNW